VTERFGVPEELAQWLEKNLPGGKHAALRWQLRQAFKAVEAWELSGELRVTAGPVPKEFAALVAKRFKDMEWTG
jgi:hypothetical protein